MPLLLLLALLAGGAAYYEYNWEQQSTTGFQGQIQQLESQLAQLKSENKKLNDEKANLARQTPTVLPANDGGTTALPGQAPVLPPATGSAPIEDLATFTTITGKTYQDPKLLKIEATDIVISSAEGITQVSYDIMPPDLQKKFGWDPKKSTTLNAAEIRYQQQLDAARAAAAADGANAAPGTAPANPNLVPGTAPAPGAPAP
jgi:hypothetical protein